MSASVTFIKSRAKRYAACDDVANNSYSDRKSRTMHPHTGKLPPPRLILHPLSKESASLKRTVKLEFSSRYRSFCNPLQTALN